MNLKKPVNYRAMLHQPMLLAVMPVARLKIAHEVTIRYNLGTGDWHIEGQKGNPAPYIFKGTLDKAVNLMFTIAHYNRTGDKVKFDNGDKKHLELP